MKKEEYIARYGIEKYQEYLKKQRGYSKQYRQEHRETISDINENIEKIYLNIKNDIIKSILRIKNNIAKSIKKIYLNTIDNTARPNTEEQPIYWMGIVKKINLKDIKPT